MRIGGLLGIAALLLVACGDGATPASAPISFFEGHQSAIYELDEHWLCRRDLPGDVCDADLDSTEVRADGTMTPEPHVPAAAPTFDCFYVYPTVRLGTEGGMHPIDANVAIGNLMEIVESQAAAWYTAHE